MNNAVYRLGLGFCLFVGYALYGVAWKLGDFYILAAGYGKQDLASLTAVIALAKLSVSFISGAVVAKIVAKKVFNYTSKGFAIGVALAGLGLYGMTYMNSLEGLLLTRVIVGAGGALIVVCQTPITAIVFKGKELKIMNGFSNSAYNIGIALCLTIAAYLSTNANIAVGLVSRSAWIVSLLMILMSILVYRGVSVEDNVEENKDTKVKVEKSSILEGFKSKFNWIFCIAFAGAVGFYTIAFTFIDPSIVMSLLYAGVVGNLVGVYAAGRYDVYKVSLIASKVAWLLSVPFLFWGNQVIAILLGFTLFFSLPSYTTTAYVRKGATPQSITTTFTILWVGSSLIISILVKVFAYVQAISVNGGNILLVVLMAIYAIGVQLLAKYYRTEAEPVPNLA